MLEAGGWLLVKGGLLKPVAILLLLVIPASLAHAESESLDSCVGCEAFSRVLSQYVDEKGLVNYKGLKESPAELLKFTNQLAAFPKQEFSKFSDSEKIAFWINAYNGLTLKLIIDHYPIKASLLKSALYPKNSIRQISGAWDEKKFNVLGEMKTLDQIEHEILRKEFNEPRIHMALVCAAKSCPKLLNEPYCASSLDEQLNKQSKDFLTLSKNFKITKNNAQLSSIFKWFGEDFLKKYSDEIKSFGSSRLSETERALIYFISQHLDNSRLSRVTKVEYNTYDWSLNEN